MAKSYFSGFAKRSAREERAKQIAKITTELQWNPAFISAEAAVAMKIGTEHNIASKATMLSLKFKFWWIFLRKNRQASK